MKQDDKQSAVILSVIGILPVVWLALLIAPSVKGGLPEILPKLMTVFNNPFQIRGERPVLDFKYDILKHPNVALTADGKAGVYEHGEVKSDVATIGLLSFDKYKAPETEVAETNYELLSDEDFEND